MDDAPLVDVDPKTLLSVSITGIYRNCISYVIYCNFKYNVALSAANLRCKAVGSNPDPYIKLTVIPGQQLAKLPHHSQLRVLPNCNGTIHPHWNDLVSTIFCVTIIRFLS